MPAADEAPLQLAAVQLSHCVWGLHAWGPRSSDPTAGEVTAADPVPASAEEHEHAPAALPAPPSALLPADKHGAADSQARVLQRVCSEHG